MNEIICLDEKYSTTKLLTKVKPVIINNKDEKFKSTLVLNNKNSKSIVGGLRTKGYFKKSYNDKPLISIVTVVYNGENHIEQAIKSVINQSYDNIEYIVIDGGSTDRTLDIIKKYEDKIDYWISEKDEGIGDAWNKGITTCCGDVIGLLNADDIYCYENMNVLAKKYLEKQGVLIYGTTKFISNDEIVSINNKTFDEKKLIMGFGFTHTSAFVPKTIYKKVGLFNKNIKIAVDSDFLLRLYQNGIKFEKINLVTYMRLGGVSDKYNVMGYNEYLERLLHYDIIDENKKKSQLLRYKTYNTIRPMVKSKLLKNTLRQCKHSAVFSYNVLYNITPFFFMKNFLLKLVKINIGKNSYIHSGVRIYKWSNLEVDCNSVINRNCLLDNRKKITIGKNVSIAHGTKIYTCGHDIDSPYFDIKCKEVKIEDYVCIFSNVLIMPGVTLKKGSVILPGAVISKDTEEYGIYGGNPAKLIRYRNKELYYKIDYGYWGAF